MKSKFVTALALSVTLVTMIAGHPVFGNTSNNPLSEHSLPPGRVDGTGTYFEIKDSEYLNIILTSDKDIKILLESFPKIVSLIVEGATDGSNSAILTIKGLEPDKTYYKYQDSYKNRDIFVSDENGNYVWTQDLSKSRHIWFQEGEPVNLRGQFLSKAATVLSDTVFLPEQCSDYGIWNSDTSTCVLTQDLSQNVEITSDSVTLDCNNHSIIKGGSSGINLYRRRSVAVKNCNILGDNGLAGINFFESHNNTFVGNKISNSSIGINVYGSNNNTFTDNRIIGSKIYGIDIYGSIDNIFTGNNIVDNGYYGVDFFSGSDNNTFVGNDIENSFYGIDIYESQNNKIYHNNFINNSFQTNIYEGINNSFDSGYPLGGNYWSDYIGVDVKKGSNQDQNGSDGIGDMSYMFDGGQDNFPFMESNGWETPIILPHPVLIVPGIAGTELWNEDELIWADLERMFWDVGDEFLTENLSLDENGNSTQNILAKKVIERMGRSPFEVNIFQNLKSSLELGGYETDQNLFFFLYDWRLDLDNTKDFLNQKIEEIKSQTGSSKVDIIAHSMGGLLTKAYIEAYGKDSIDKLIFVGTPHLGAPKAGKTLLEGDNFSIPWLDAGRIKELALNMPSLHQLLPSQTYFSEFQGYIKPFSFFANPPFYDYEQTKDYFINSKSKNPIMFDTAEDFFSKSLDELDLSGIDAYNIAGCKASTQAGYKMSFFNNIGLVGYSSGDGTVPFISADYLNIPEPNKYYVKNGKHSELPSTNGVRELILDILNNQTTTMASNISQSSDFCNFKGKSMTWRSPVEVHIYDQFGNHTGPIENNGIEYGILGADYEIINGQKFVFLSTDEGQEYVINGVGEDDGTFDLLISEINNGDILSTRVYNDVPIMLNSQINFDISENSDDAVIEYDFENSGRFYDIESDAILDGAESDDLVPPETQVVLTGRERRDGSFISDVMVELEANDNLSGVLKTWYSLDGVNFKEYIEPFELKRRNVYNLYYYSSDRAGNNEEINVLEIKVGITQKQFEKCWQSGKCSRIIRHGHGKKSEIELKDIKKEFLKKLKEETKKKKDKK